jgi:hypothetical protein
MTPSVPAPQASYVLVFASLQEVTRLAPPVQALLQYLRSPFEVALRLQLPPSLLAALGFSWFQNRSLSFTLVPPLVGQAVDLRALDSSTREPLQAVLRDPEFALALVASRELQKPTYLLSWNDSLRTSVAIEFNIGTVVSGMVVAPAGTAQSYSLSGPRVYPIPAPSHHHEPVVAALTALRGGRPMSLPDLERFYTGPGIESHSFVLMRAKQLVVPPQHLKPGTT